jgi:Spy/CpxP family protein refolding chaperone
MKKIVPLSLFAICLGLFTPLLPAQTAEGLEKAEAVAHQLNLTPQQEAQVLPILKQEAPKIKEVKSNASLSGMQKIRKVRAIHEETDPQMKKVLSPEQYQKLQAIREQQIQEAIAKKRGGR